MEDSKGTPDAPEESGWTSYFEDFLSKQREEEEENNSLSESFCSPSLVSDAASCVPLKIKNYNQVPPTCSPMEYSSSSILMPKKLSFKKTRTREISHDDSLEDTASSPVNSPKVSSLKQMDINPRKREDNVIETSLVKGGGGSDLFSEIQTEEGNEVTFEGKNNEYTELKKRGLCLVPLSMLVNFLG